MSRLDYGSATLAGLSSQLIDRLQSVQNARVDHIHVSGACVPLLHGLALIYLSADLVRVFDVGSRQRLCSATTSALVDRRTKRATIGDCAFIVAA